MAKVASLTTQHASSPRILLLSDEYPPAGGGAGVIAKQVAHYLHRHHYPVTVISGDSGEKETEFPHILVKQQRLLWALHYWNTLRQTDTLEQYDVIILNDYLSAYLAGLCLPEHLLARCVMVVHGRDAFFYFHRQSKKHLLFQYQRYYARTIKYCKKILHVSQYTQKQYLSDLPDAFTQMISDKSQVCYAGIDYQKFNRSDVPVPSGLSKIPPQTRILFSVGRLTKTKGFDDMLSAFKVLLDTSSNAYHWVIAGDGDYRITLEHNIRQYGLEQYITITGHLSHHELIPYYQRADCFWLLSHHETYGLVYLEAAFFDLASIGYKNTGVQEAIHPGFNGYFFTQTEPLEPLIEKCMTLKLERTPHTVCKNYSIEYFINQLLDRPASTPHEHKDVVLTP